MNLGENNNFFRESFRGFNKDDVAEYIAKLSKDYTANEEKYKEHIAKLTAELKAKTDELSNFDPEFASMDGQTGQFDEIEQRYKEEISRLTDEIADKDATISSLQVQLELSRTEPAGLLGTGSEEIIKYQELIGNLSKEIEQLKEESEKAEAESVQENQASQFEQFEQNAEAINLLSFQLSECESEKLFLLNLLKKFIVILDLETAREKDVEHAATISEIGPKLVIAEEIESKLYALAGLKDIIGRLEDKINELETENANLKTMSAEKQETQSDEQKIYESITADLGSIIYSAKKTAEEITTKAETDAEDKISNAQFEADAIIGNANAKKESILEESRNNMAEFREKFGFIKKEYEEMQQKYKELSENYMLHMSEIEGTLNVIYDTASRESGGGQ